MYPVIECEEDFSVQMRTHWDMGTEAECDPWIQFQGYAIWAKRFTEIAYEFEIAISSLLGPVPMLLVSISSSTLKLEFMSPFWVEFWIN
ncbi:hypothetical protein L2E82_51228 [Cichorium intybus]|nr:hypothetical protein L2E82_51228 [Cichorium intybus]